MMLPFSGGIEETANATLVFSLAAALLYAVSPAPTRPRAKTAARTLAIALLGVLAAVQNGPPLIVGALALASLGQVLQSLDDARARLGSMASDLAARLAYTVLFASAGGGWGEIILEPWRAGLALVVIAAAAVLFLRLRWQAGPGERAAGAVYAVAVAGMVLAALTTEGPGSIAGALLLAVSDVLTAAQRFLLAASPNREAARIAAWISGYVGQLLITMAFLLA